MKNKLRKELIDILDAAIERYDDDYNWQEGPFVTVQAAYYVPKSLEAVCWLGQSLHDGCYDNPAKLRRFLKRQNRQVWHELKVVAWREDDEWARLYWRAWLMRLRESLGGTKVRLETHEVSPNTWSMP